LGKSVIYLSALRPVQWIKNGFVLAPLVFSHQFTNWVKCVNTGIAFISFCAISSAIYLFNDICDYREDIQHPVKKHRAVASGAITRQQALWLAVMLTALSLGLGWFAGGRLIGVVAIYALVNVIYSLGIKHVPIVDVMTIAAGFVLRILGGSVAISVAPSHWLVLCTIMISLFLGFTKRRAELISAGQTNSSARIVLKDYSVAFLDQVIAVVTGATIICYALYTVDARTLEVFDTRAMLLTVPSVIYGIFRYLYIAYHLNEAEDPTRAVLSDIPTLINLAIWLIIAVMVVIYGKELKLFA